MTDKLFIKIISSDKELDEGGKNSYRPLRYNHVYIAEKVGRRYYRVYLEGDEGYHHTIHESHIEVIELQEIREDKLKKLRI